MAALKTITSANSSFLLTVPGIFSAPQALHGYTADAAFEHDAVDVAEVMKGVDNRMSAGWVANLQPQNVSLNPDSDSVEIFELWNETQKAQQEVMYAFGVIILPSVQKKYNLTKGILTRYSNIPSARRVLQGRTFTITWDNISPVPTV